MIVEFFAAGRARPKGSKRMVRTSGGRTLLLEDSKREGPWRQSVSSIAQQEMVGRARFLERPLAVLMVFGFARPKSHYRKAGLRSDAPTWHTGKPDSSKLARSVEDALNGIVWDDDSRIAHLVVVKRYVESDESVGVAVMAYDDPAADVMRPMRSLAAFYRQVASGRALSSLAEEVAHAAP